MSLLREMLGTFLMFVGFIGILTGALLYRTKQQDLGRMYMSATMMAGGEMSEGPMVQFLTSLRGNDPLKKRWAIGILLGGILLALLGASMA